MCTNLLKIPHDVTKKIMFKKGHFFIKNFLDMLITLNKIFMMLHYFLMIIWANKVDYGIKKI